MQRIHLDDVDYGPLRSEPLRLSPGGRFYAEDFVALPSATENVAWAAKLKRVVYGRTTKGREDRACGSSNVAQTRVPCWETLEHQCIYMNSTNASRWKRTRISNTSYVDRLCMTAIFPAERYVGILNDSVRGGEVWGECGWPMNYSNAFGRWLTADVYCF